MFEAEFWVAVSFLIFGFAVTEALGIFSLLIALLLLFAL